MKRVLIVGNSHVAALKTGWDSLAAHYADRLDLAFFVAPAPYFDRLGLTGSLYGNTDPSLLTAAELASLVTLNGQTTVDLARFDHILLVGMVWPGFNEIAPFLKGFAIDGLYQADKPQRLTSAAFTAFYQAVLDLFPAPGLWSTLHRPRVTLMLHPMPAAIIRDVPPDQLAYDCVWTAKSIEVDQMRPLLDHQRSLAARHYARHGIALLPQPTATLTASGLTLNEFCRDRSAFTGKPLRKFDCYHMDSRFGAACLHDYFAQILPPT